MRENRTLGSVRGHPGNWVSYLDKPTFGFDYDYDYDYEHEIEANQHPQRT